jgi:hypothetical protein
VIRILTVVALVGAVLAAWLFPRAFPIVVLSNRITREVALQRADSFAKAHALPSGARTAIQFSRDDSLHTFIDLAGGGADSLEALVLGNDAAPYRWSVRAFTPLDVHETKIHMAADGRFIGFERKFAEADARPALDSAAAQRMAHDVLVQWLRETPERWTLAATSYETRKTSGRVDRTFTYERRDRKIGGAPARLAVVIAGDTPSQARPYVDVPESFLRRYGEMRASNELFSNLAVAAMLGIALAGALGLRRFSREKRVRWRPAMIVGLIVAGLMGAAGVNSLSSLWFGYDTALPAGAYLALIVVGGAASAVMLGLLVAVTLAAAEVSARAAYPNHMDWWALWRHRGTREVGVSVAGGYALAATGIAYVSAFYLLTRSLFGWWVPAEVLDDPNQIATAMPWLAGLAASFQAAVWEEALFRALPLSLLSLWVGDRPRRTQWMAAGVIATALVFGFAHSDYPSWPAYSRGFEIFLEACLWGAVFLRFGILMTVVAHFLFNMTLFGMFAASGATLPYLVSAAIVALILLSPALAVAWRWVRQRGLVDAPAEAKSGAWQPGEDDPAAPVVVSISTGALSERSRRWAMYALAGGVVVALATPSRPVLGPKYTTDRFQATAVADSVLLARGVDTAGWRRLATSASADSVAIWRRLLRREKAESVAQALATTYAVPTWWIVRYVHTTEPVASRTEEWRVRVRPDGVPIDVRHLIPDSAAGRTLVQSAARRIARTALAGAGLDTNRLKEANLEETARPARRDVKVTYTDTTVKLPADAAARAWVTIAGDVPLVVRRGIEMPEKFLRDDAGEQTRRSVISILFGLALVTFVIVGAVFVIRQRTPLIDDGVLSGRGRLWLMAAVALLMLLASLNGLPGELASYDTAKPWSSYLTSNLITSVAGAVFMALVMAGLWLAVDALRRRAGVPVWAQPRASGLGDGLVAGLGIVGVSAFTDVFGLLARQVSKAGMPSAPSPLFDNTVPILSGAIELPVSIITMIPVAAIPLLVIVGLASQTRTRALIALLMLGLGAGALFSSGEAPTQPAQVAASVATLIVTVMAFRAWAATSAMTWIVAAIGSEILPMLRGTFTSGSVTAAGARVLAIVLGVAMIYWLERTSRAAAPGAIAPGGQ